MSLNNNLSINPTETTPSVNFDSSNGELEMNGVLLPLDCDEFFNPLLNWLDHYLVDPAVVTTIALKFEYINTRASKYLFQMLLRLKSCLCENKKISVKWMYESDDLDMLETGEDFNTLMDFEFEFVGV